MGAGVTAGEDERLLLSRCLAGDAAAVRDFQVRFGELIYGYPQRVYGIDAEEAGDFYVFALEHGRIFRRAQSFAGRASLRTYLGGFVLDHLILEWKRGQRTVDSVNIDNFDDLPSSPDAATVDDAPLPMAALLSGLDPPRAVLFKLLHIEDSELSPRELRYLCSCSGSTPRQVLVALESLREAVRTRQVGMQQAADAADSVHAWIQLYERRLRRIDTDLASISPEAAEPLLAEKVELERKLAWRHRQRARVLALSQRRKVTAPYKAIAELLDTSIGNVSSQILRLRRELAQRLRSLRDED